MATTALKFIACWDSSSKCVYICVFVWKKMTIFLDVPVGCACASFCVSNCSLSVGGKCSSHLALLSLTFGTSREALAFSLSFPHSFLKAPSSNQWVREQGPVGRTAPLPKKGAFNLSPLASNAFFFCLTPLSSSLWSSTSSVCNYFLIFRSYIAGGGGECTCYRAQVRENRVTRLATNYLESAQLVVCLWDE